MKNTLKLLIVFFLMISILYYIEQSYAAKRAGCKAYIYIANNSLFACTLNIDGFNYGTLLIGKSKVYKIELLNDAPKKIKVKVYYDDPDFLDPKSYILLTKKLECEQTDTVYIAHTK